MTLPNWKDEDFFIEYLEDAKSTQVSQEVLERRRKVYDISNYFLKDILLTYERANRQGYGLGALFVTLAAVDYLAGFYCGKETKRQDYINFMMDFYPEKYHPYLNAIYRQIRSGLLHNLVSVSPWGGDDQIDFNIFGESHLHLEEVNGKISFSIPVIIEDTRRAFLAYRYKLLMKPEENRVLVKHFEERLKPLENRGAILKSQPE